MDFVAIKSRIIKEIGKYKYVAIVLLAGVVLMLIPGENTAEAEVNLPNEPQQIEGTVEERLEQIISKINGAGKAKVMLTVARGEQIIYQTDSNYTQGENNTDSRTQTVLITDSDRAEKGLVHQKNPPQYMGAIVLIQGADDPVVKLAVVNAVSNVTGLGTDKISVLKMQ